MSDESALPVAETAPPKQRVRSINFPWGSVLGGLAALAYVLVVTDPWLRNFYQLPELLLLPEFKLALLALFTVLLLMDMRRFRLQHRRQMADIEHLQTQLKDLWQSKKQLQLKAHTYAGHADKLKLFISDKLLEYIEYDEKFLHFKSIAAEVRHNGVISFDKVQSALQQALSNATDQSQQAQRPNQEAYREALEAMRYLWDLLDLSTADNLALHIGNLLCECEEHYYQQLLDQGQQTELPYPPVYAPLQTTWRALALVRAEPTPTPAKNDQYQLQDAHWYIQLTSTNVLLGNPNHLVLMLENLLRNAQYFAARRGYKSAFAPVAVLLHEEAGHACFRIYNRGPHIKEEDRPNLFQLGFSTRKAKQHQGRGLGLYFVNQIVLGYEGQISVRNIHTAETLYAIRLALRSGEVSTRMVQVRLMDGQPQCELKDQQLAPALDWEVASAIDSIEVTATDTGETQRLELTADESRQQYFDPAHPERPHWRLSCHGKRGKQVLEFEPLDISGVEFVVRLPTAQCRLENSELQTDDIDAQVQALEARFAAQAQISADL